MRRPIRISLLLILFAGLTADSPEVSAQKGGKGKQGQTAGRQKNGNGRGQKGGGKDVQKGDRGC